MSDWTKEDEHIVLDLYPTSTKEELLKALPGKTYEAIEHKARRLGVRRQNNDAWTDLELSILIKEYPYVSKERLMEILPGRLHTSIRNKAATLGIKKAGQTRPIKTDSIYKGDLSLIEGNKFRFGIVSDTHFGSRYAQITYLHQFYRLLEKREIYTCFHSGDLSDGNGTHYRGQRYEMYLTGADELRDHLVRTYPKFKDGKTYAISGAHDLDLWVQEGYDLLKSVHKEREDLVYLGQHDATFMLGSRKLYLIHPGGGKAYALSYKPQKLVESFSSENKPHLVIIGHYHTAEFIPLLRNVVVVQGGNFQAQTPFATRKNLQWQYGGWIIEMTVDKHGIASVVAEFIPIYNPITDDWKNFY